MSKPSYALVLALLLGIVASECVAVESGSTGLSPIGKLLSLKTAYGTRFDAYVTGHDDARYGALLVPDRWGLNTHIRLWADRLAGIGYRAVALDLYDGRAVRNARMSREVYDSIDPIWIKADLEGALDFLRKRQKNIAILGWGVNVKHATWLALQQPGAVYGMIAFNYHGSTLEDVDKLSARGVQVLGVFVEQGFIDSHTALYDQEAVEKAWRATRPFMERVIERSP